MEKNENQSITNEELVESLMLVSEATKALAQEIILRPPSDGKETSKKN